MVPTLSSPLPRPCCSSALDSLEGSGGWIGWSSCLAVWLTISSSVQRFCAGEGQASPGCPEADSRCELRYW